MFRLLKVTGESLSPVYREGDFVLVVKVPFLFDPLRRGLIKQGDVVVFKHPRYGTLIKMVARVQAESGEVFVVGMHPFSTDSRQFGAIPLRDLIGKVIWHIRKPGI